MQTLTFLFFFHVVKRLHQFPNFGQLGISKSAFSPPNLIDKLPENEVFFSLKIKSECRNLHFPYFPSNVGPMTSDQVRDIRPEQGGGITRAMHHCQGSLTL